MYQKVSTDMNFVARELETLAFWKKNKVFEKSVALRKGAPTYTFFDGPPTANGKPHIGHVLTRSIKDLIPRYKTMKGPQLRRLVITDFRELVYSAETHKDKLFLIRIHKLENYIFDKHTQVFSMVISDRDGRNVTGEVKYFAENKEFVENIEEICGRIKDTVNVWTMLVSARIKNGCVMLYPIEFYDFIEDMDFHSFSPSSEDTVVDPQYAHVLLNLLSEVENSVVRCVRSGLSSTVENHTPLIEKIKRCGMSGLATLAENFFSSADNYRNSLDQETEKILSCASKLMKYINLAENKLGRISALHNMNNIEEEE